MYGAERRDVRLQLQFVHRLEPGGWERELEDRLAEFWGEGEEGGWGGGGGLLSVWAQSG